MSNSTCSVPGCEKTGKMRRGWCGMHYSRWRTHGDPLTVTIPKSAEISNPDLLGKTCIKCREYKPHDEYTRASKGSDKRDSECKACVRERQRNNPRKYQRNREWERQQKAAQTEWAKARRDKQSHVRYLRRLAMRANYVEFVSPAVVFERDDYTCQICGDPMNMDETHPEPLSPSLDHIVPVSRGGAHSYANIQAAHLRCNIAKGDREALAEMATTH